MTMIIQDRVTVINSVQINTFELDTQSREITITYNYGNKVGTTFTSMGSGHLYLGTQAFLQFVNWVPNGTDSLKQQLLPLIYQRIAKQLGESVGPIDLHI